MTNRGYWFDAIVLLGVFIAHQTGFFPFETALLLMVLLIGYSVADINREVGKLNE